MRALLFTGLLIAAVAFLTAACITAESSPEPSRSDQNGQAVPSDGLPIDFETIAAGQHTGVVGQQPQVFKIETQAQWEDFWAQHQSIVLSATDLPPVDFSQQMVIAAVDQREPSGGYQFEITGIEADESELTVQVSKRVPGPDCRVTAVITQPIHIVRTAKSDLEPQLTVTEETYSCG